MTLTRARKLQILTALLGLIIGFALTYHPYPRQETNQISAEQQREAALIISYYTMNGLEVRPGIANATYDTINVTISANYGSTIAISDAVERCGIWTSAFNATLYHLERPDQMIFSAYLRQGLNLYCIFIPGEHIKPIV